MLYTFYVSYVQTFENSNCKLCIWMYPECKVIGWPHASIKGHYKTAPFSFTRLIQQVCMTEIMQLLALLCSSIYCQVRSNTIYKHRLQHTKEWQRWWRTNISNKPDWKTNTVAVCRMGVSRLYVLRKLRPKNVDLLSVCGGQRPVHCCDLLGEQHRSQRHQQTV